MFSSYLYWFIYRRRNKFLICLMIIFCIVIYLHQNDSQSSSATNEKLDKRVKKNVDGKKIRVNRDTYTSPEPCRDCPGEGGQGVQLTVMMIRIDKYREFLCFSARGIPGS